MYVSTRRRFISLQGQTERRKSGHITTTIILIIVKKPEENGNTIRNKFTIQYLTTDNSPKRVQERNVSGMKRHEVSLINQ